MIHSIRAGVVIEIINYLKVECHGVNHGLHQQWYFQRSNRGYALKNVKCGGFVGINDTRSGSRLEKVCDHNAIVWNLERQYDDVYTISIPGTLLCITLPEGQDKPGTHLLVTERNLTKGQLWRFQKLSEDSGGFHQPQNAVHIYPQYPSMPAINADSNTIVSGDPDSPYIDDAHLYTDMLFNLPRNAFNRVQRAAVLEWARRMGATNVPTLESLDECERRMDSGQSNVADSNISEQNLRREQNSSATE